MQVRLWPKNEAALKKLVQDAKADGATDGLLSVAKLANWAVSIFVLAKTKKKK